MENLSLDEINSALQYCPGTGEFFWKYRPDMPQKWNTRLAGKRAGANKKGYVQLTINYKHVGGHRVAWFICNEYWPNVIDHINQNKSDNRITNLRNTDKAGNARNTKLRKGNPFGLMGVGWEKSRNCFRAYIRDRNRYITLARGTLLDCAAARKSAEIRLGYSELHGLS